MHRCPLVLELLKFLGSQLHCWLIIKPPASDNLCFSIVLSSASFAISVWLSTAQKDSLRFWLWCVGQSTVFFLNQWWVLGVSLYGTRFKLFLRSLKTVCFSAPGPAKGLCSLRIQLQLICLKQGRLFGFFNSECFPTFTKLFLSILEHMIVYI